MNRLLQAIMIALSLAQALQAEPESRNPLLKPNDRIRLAVFEEPELDTQTRILKSGDVVLPLIGTVKISGLTVSQANDTVRNLYARAYFVDPKVVLTIEEYSQDFVFVVGTVPFPVDGRLDLLAAVAQAGGYTELANPKKVSINRKGQVTILNLKEMTDKGDQRYLLQPDDIVTIAQRFF